MGCVICLTDRPASSASDTKLASATTCCTCCFGSKKRWSDSASAQMSDVYCRTCDEANSPACLANVTPKRNRPKHRNLLTVESEIEMPGGGGGAQKKKIVNKEKKKSPKTPESPRKDIKKTVESPKMSKKNNNRDNMEEYELADDATSLNGDMTDDIVKIGVLSDLDPRMIVRVHGKEELPVVEQSRAKQIQKLQKQSLDPEKDPHPLRVEVEYHADNDGTRKGERISSDANLNSKTEVSDKAQKDAREGDLNGNSKFVPRKRFYSTFPKRKRSTIHHSMWYNRPISLKKVPQRTTPDGTNIYYWCDVPKKSTKGGDKKLLQLYFSFFFWCYPKDFGERELINRIDFFFAFSLCRIGRWGLQSALGHKGIHTDFPLLEGESSAAIHAIECIPDLCHSSLVEHRERSVEFLRLLNLLFINLFIAGKCNAISQKHYDKKLN